MDIKNWILIGGGLLLVGVVAHGFWLAWRNRRDTLRLAIDPNIPREAVDELVLLRGELPNGGARVAIEPDQGRLDLETDAPVLMDQDPQSAPAQARRAVEPTIGEALEPAADPEEFQLEPVEAEPLTAERRSSRTQKDGQDRAPGGEQDGAPAKGTAPVAEKDPAPSPERTSSRPAKPSRPREPEADEAVEIIVINVLARDGAQFPGEQLMDVFLRNELKFGDMNIFHRVDPATKAVLFSVASATEPGTFDLSSMEDFRTRGVTMFLRLPGPGEPLEVFDDMLDVARDIASSLGGDLKDEQLSVMTGQTSEHCRQRIAEFSRKRMSQRA